MQVALAVVHLSARSRISWLIVAAADFFGKVACWQIYFRGGGV